MDVCACLRQSLNHLFEGRWWRWWNHTETNSVCFWTSKLPCICPLAPPLPVDKVTVPIHLQISVPQPPPPHQLCDTDSGSHGLHRVLDSQANCMLLLQEPYIHKHNNYHCPTTKWRNLSTVHGYHSLLKHLESPNLNVTVSVWKCYVLLDFAALSREAVKCVTLPRYPHSSLWYTSHSSYDVLT